MKTDNYTELDRQLQTLASTDWGAFVALVGLENITSAKICILRAQGKSLQQIASKFKKSKGWAQKINEKKCQCNEETYSSALSGSGNEERNIFAACNS